VQALETSIIRWLPDANREMHGQRAFARHAAEKPSSDNLPQIETAPADAMLIVTSFGEYLPERASAGPGRAVVGPAPQVYSVRYSLPGAPKQGPDVGPHVDVNVQEWPNSDWARWELAEQNYSPTMNNATEETIKFGNRIVSTRGSGNSSYKWGPSSSCAWSSSNRLVM
jgi:hypothetical protein